MFPDAAMQRRLHNFGTLSETDDARWEERFAAITEG
jgi:hypothetical protein